jgi:hypothetical protein
MTKQKLADIDLTFSNNTDALGQSTAGSANANTIDTIFQKLMVMLALFYDEIGGTGTVAGTADAITLTTNATYPFQALAAGLVVAFKAASANTGAATINVDSLGVKKIRRQGDSALSANDIVANGTYLLRYDTDYDTAAGAWVLLNPTVSSSISAASTTEQLTGTDASKYATSDSVAALWEKGSDVASASAISLGEGGYFHITGTTTITDIDWATAKNGREACLIFDGALTLTHNATTLKLPGAANITTAAGDRAYFRQDSSDNVICTAYTRADGTALVVSASGMTLLQTLSPGSVTSIDTSASFSGYRRLYIEWDSVSTSSGSAAIFRIAASTTSGAAYGSASSLTTNTADATQLNFGQAEIFGVQQAVIESTMMKGNKDSVGAASLSPVLDTLERNTAAAITNLRFSWSAGNFDGGATIRIYGMS